MKGLIHKWMLENKVIIFTTGMKWEYDDETGKKVRRIIDMPDFLEYNADIILKLKIEKKKRVFKVYKNRFSDMLEEFGKTLEYGSPREVLKQLGVIVK